MRSIMFLMMVLTIWVGIARQITAADTAPIALANDGVYAERLRSVLAKEPAAGDPRLADWLREASSAASLARDYQRGEGYDRALVELQPGNADNHIGLACSLDKLGRHLDALAECDRAAGLANARQPNLNQVRAIVLYEAGQRDEAAALAKAIVPPPSGSDDWGPYQLNRAVYAAYAGDIPTIQDGLKSLQTLPGDQTWWLDYVRRDADFDSYRAAAWFIAIAGPTLAKP